MTASLHVHEAPMADCAWGFRDPGPTFRPKVEGAKWYAFSIQYDPFPAYPHDIELARQVARQVEQEFPPLWDVHLYVGDREDFSRTNGCSNSEGMYDYDTREYVGHIGFIFLGGKRVPPHPAMTKHLVAHEYGHNVQWMLAHEAGHSDTHTMDFLRVYAEMRGLDEDTLHFGDGGRWHDAVGEIFACDFRIAVCGLGLDYWPHMGIKRPEETHAIEWWQGQQERAKQRAA